MNRKHIMVLAAMSGLIGASVGVLINTSGVFYTAMAADLGVGRGSVAMSVTILSITAAFTALLVPKLINEKNLKFILITAALLMTGGTLLLTVCRSLWMIYLISVLRGLGGGLVNFVLVTMILNNWFYAKRGLITSLVLAFSGVPGVVLSPVYTNLIQSSGWQSGYMAVAVSISLFCLPAILFPIRLKPESAGLKPYGYEEFQQAKSQGKTTVVMESQDFSYSSGIFILAIVFTLMTSVVCAIPQHFPGYAETLGQTASTGAVMLSASMAANIGSKMLFGLLSDKLGTLKTILFMIVLSLAGAVILLAVNVPFMLIVGSALFCFTFSVSSVGIALVATDLFGMENYSRTYPVMNLLGGLINAFAASFTGMIYDVTGAYTLNFWMAVIMQVIIVISLTTAYRLRKNEEA